LGGWRSWRRWLEAAGAPDRATTLVLGGGGSAGGSGRWQHWRMGLYWEKGGSVGNGAALGEALAGTGGGPASGAPGTHGGGAGGRCGSKRASACGRIGLAARGSGCGERERKKVNWGGVHQTNTNYHVLEGLVFFVGVSSN
jgi:hypothetical protein